MALRATATKAGVDPAPEARSESPANRREYAERTSIVSRIARSYDWLVRAYVLIRFTIIRARILGVMDVLLPERGRILDVGCGFGLFAGYFSATAPGRTVFGVDRDARRVDMARRMAENLGISAEFAVADVRSLPPTERFDAAYILDVLHHIPYDAHRGVLEEIHRRLNPGGVLLVKDVTTYPTYKLEFTRALDKVMSPRDQLSYRHHDDWKDLLEHVGFDVRVRHLDDHLPYPHVLLICTRRGGRSS